MSHHSNDLGFCALNPPSRRGPPFALDLVWMLGMHLVKGREEHFKIKCL